MILAVRKYLRSFSILTLGVFSFNLFVPVIVYATDGPKQPEVKTFTPISTTDMVDLFTGNFNYNIPLLDVGGYPINISYTANPGMEQDASWTGLGWNINVGSIDRNLRGVPDDFSGDSIVKISKKKINRTMGVTTKVDVQVFGLETRSVGLSAGASLGVFRNNYTGNGTVAGLNVGLDLKLSEGNKDPQTMTLGVGATSSSSDGLTISPSLSFSNFVSKGNKNIKTGSFSLGSSFNTQQGWKELSLNYGIPLKESKDPQSKQRGGQINGSASISFAQPAMPPVISMPTFSAGFSFNASIGGEIFGLHPNANIRAYYSQQSLKDDISMPLSSPTDLLVPGFIHGESLGSGITFNPLSIIKDHSKVILPAYGYLYAHNARSEKVLHDFSREKEGAFTIHRPNLPIPNFTHDIYTVEGQGISGMYRPFRNDIGILHDPQAVSSSANLDFPGIEIGGGNAVHVGLNFAVTLANNTTRKWSSAEDFNGVFGFRGFDQAQPSNFQPYYFKQAGEKTVDFSPGRFDSLGAFNPVRVGLTGDPRTIVEAAADPFGIVTNDDTKAQNTLLIEKGRNVVGNIVDVKTNKKSFRQPRNQDIQFLNAFEAKTYALDTALLTYPKNEFKMNENGTYHTDVLSSRFNTSVGRLAHHISEITAVRADGSRYIYGLPLYNTLQKEVSFALECNGKKLDYVNGCDQGLVYYNSNSDNSLSNENGIDHSFESETTPPYAHAFLLTTIISDDYVDVKQDGPSDDDLGSYTQFNYTQAAGDHMWRTPYEENAANYFAGFNADMNDGKGSYTFGKRELRYLHSIVTKTHVAEFVLADREDAVGVAGENGGKGSAKMQKLIRIDLYAKPDKIKELKSNGSYTAVPLKSVHFVYNYSLCQGIPSNTKQADANTAMTNEQGKLSLRKIFFTYQNSNKARLSFYEFEYANNPSYAPKAQDRWGTYKPHNVGSSCEEHRTNTDFPYTDQEKASADLNAAAWNLTKITLPSGAIMNITYESDDYGYVQNKFAMQMFPLAGIGNDLNNTPVADFQNLPSNPVGVGKYVFFKLSKPLDGNLTTDQAKQEVRDRYLKELAFQQQKLYFKCFADMPNGAFDFVPGYADIDIAGTDGYGAVKKNGSTAYNFGFIKIKAVNAGSNSNVNPITKSALNLVKMNMPLLIKEGGGDVNCKDNFGDDMQALIVSITGLYSGLAALTSTYDVLLSSNKSIGKNIRLNKSMIRLFNPYQNKLGGGSRVKSITISDDWNTMTGNPVSVYGQTYEYTTSDGLGGIISSGVASYEPIVGGEENVFRQPVFFDEDRLGVPDEEYFMEEPMGESFFPAASVGYSKVTVRDIAVSENNDTTFTKTGKVVHEFYTAKDFPTRVDDTNLDYRRQKPSIIAQLLKISVEDYVTVSQGYVAELNDMHGKRRSESVFQEAATTSPGVEEAPLTSVVYKYKTDPATGTLDNNVLVVNRSAVTGKNEFIENRMVGVDYDFIADMRENESSTLVVTMQGNVETFLAAIFPIIIPIVLPDLQTEKIRYRSAVTSKVINRYGLLQETITQDLGKQDTLRNVLYDAESGEVLLSQTKNAFNDPVFSFNYPAYFGYDAMGPSYANSGVVLKTSSLENITGASKFFVKGDELLAYNIDSAGAKKPAYFKGWVMSVTNDAISIIDKDGYPLKQTAGTGNYVLKVLRSGKRNLQGSSMGKIVTLQNPLTDSNGDGKFDALQFDKVLDAQAIEYNDQWKVFCNCNENKPEPVPVVK